MCTNCGQDEQPVKQVNVTTLTADFWRSNVGTLQPDTVNDYTEAISHNGPVAIGSLDPKSAFDVTGSVIFRQLTALDYPANSPIGPAATTVDVASVIAIPQITDGITVTLPVPTNVQAGRLLYIENTGTKSITVDTEPVPAGKMGIFAWSGTDWVPVAASGSGAATTNDFWRSGTGSTLPDGTTDPTENVSRPGNTGIGIADPATIAANLDVGGAQVLRSVVVANLATGGQIGTAAATVDAKSTIILSQTTANQALTLPNPTNTTAGRLLYVTHNGTVPTTVAGKPISPGETLTFIWDGNTWNGNAAPIVADFWRSGVTASTLPDGVTDPTDDIVHNGKVGIGDTAAFTNAGSLAAALDLSGAEVLRQISLANFAASGAIGAASTTVDVASTISLNQTTSNISLTIPTPTNTTAGRVLNVANVGTAQVKVAGQYITPKTAQSYIYSGAVNGWIPLGDNPDVLVVGASRLLSPTDHLKTILATAAITLTVPANIGYILLRIRQQTAGSTITIVGAAGVTVVAPYGATTIGIAGTSLIVECFQNTVWVE
jgi:hypothetical protein